MPPEPIAVIERPRYLRHVPGTEAPEVVIETRTADGAVGWHCLTRNNITSRLAPSEFQQIRNAAKGLVSYMPVARYDDDLAVPSHVHLGSYKIAASNVSIDSTVLTLAPDDIPGTIKLLIRHHNDSVRDHEFEASTLPPLTIRADHVGARTVTELASSLSSAGAGQAVMGPLELLKGSVSPKWLSDCLVAMGGYLPSKARADLPSARWHAGGLLAF